MQLEKAIQNRKSVRKFKDKKPDWRKIIEAIDSSRYAPMAGDNYTLKFILVEDKKKIQKIAESTQQDFCEQVHYIVVAVSNPERTINLYGQDRGERYCRQQAGAAIQNFLLKLTELGLDTCWVGHFYDNMIKEALKIPENCFVEAVFPIGFEYNDIKPSKKIELDRIIRFHDFKTKKMRGPNRIEA